MVFVESLSRLNQAQFWLLSLTLKKHIFPSKLFEQIQGTRDEKNTKTALWTAEGRPPQSTAFVF